MCVCVLRTGMKFIHLFICYIFMILFHGKMLGESILAFQDASIKEGTTINGNWSKNEVFGNPDNPIVALVEFDMSHLSGKQTLVSAIFRPYVRTLKDSKSSTFSIYSTGSQNWLQDSVTWNTRPTRGALLDSISINEKAVRVDFNVTQALQDAISDGKNKITFWIEDSEKEYESFEFDSVNKNPSYPNEPELVLYKGSENTSTGTGQQEETSQGNNNALPVNTLIQGGRILQLLGTTVNEKDWNENSGGGILHADLGSLSDLDQSKPILYQWYVNGNPLIGATGNNISLGSYGLSEASLQLSASYTSSSGESLIVFSPIINNEDWRIYSGGESGNVSGDNPTPFFETYSFTDSSRTHDGSGWFKGGYRASATHSITSVNAEEVGVPSLEGSNILKVKATSGSKRAELGNRNYNTRFQENQNAYIAAKIYLPKEEWDPVTQYSTIIFQHKQYPGADPNFEIRLSNEGDYKLYVTSYYGHYGLPKKGDVNYTHDHKTIATLTPNFWHDLKIHLTPSQDSESGQITIYLDGKVIFSGNGSNLNDKDNTNDSFLKLGMYTNIYDDRHFFLDAVEMTTYLLRSVADWVSSTPTDIDSPSFVSATAVAFDDGFTEGNNTGVQNVIENPQRYNLFTEQDINSILERERSIYELKARKEGEDAVLQNPALYGLKSLDYAGKASPYTLEWFYEENLGWVYTNNSIFPYFFKSKKANEPSAWLYFDNGSYPPRFYNYNTEEWFELKE